MKKTIKVIDLLNKKANGETLPKKIGIYRSIYTLSKEYWVGMCFKYMYENNFGNWCDENLGLNDEVEIIDDEVETIDENNNKEYTYNDMINKLKDIKELAQNSGFTKEELQKDIITLRKEYQEEQKKEKDLK